MKLNTTRVIVIFCISFAVMLAALLNIPALSQPETCVRAALVITGAYAWFAGILWANVVLPMMRK